MLIFAAFIRRRSCSQSSRRVARPTSGFSSWRQTPRSFTAWPLMRSTPPVVEIWRKPTAEGPRVGDGAALRQFHGEPVQVGSFGGPVQGRVHVHGEQRVARRAAVGRNRQHGPLNFFAIGRGQDGAQLVALVGSGVLPPRPPPAALPRLRRQRPQPRLPDTSTRRFRSASRNWASNVVDRLDPVDVGAPPACPPATRRDRCRPSPNRRWYRMRSPWWTWRTRTASRFSPQA